jgi:hypothetical protein
VLDHSNETVAKELTELQRLERRVESLRQKHNLLLCHFEALVAVLESKKLIDGDKLDRTAAQIVAETMKSEKRERGARKPRLTNRSDQPNDAGGASG